MFLHLLLIKPEMVLLWYNEMKYLCPFKIGISKVSKLQDHSVSAAQRKRDVHKALKPSEVVLCLSFSYIHIILHFASFSFSFFFLSRRRSLPFFFRLRS